MPTPLSSDNMRIQLAGIIDKRKTTDGTLTKLLFPAQTEVLLQEEFAQVDVADGTYSMAPFNLLGQNPFIMAGQTSTSYNITTPYINIMRPLQHTSKLFARQMGMGIVNPGNVNMVAMAIQTALTDDARILEEAIRSRKEWMVAQLLTGTMTYSQEGQDSFTLSTGKPGDNTVTAAPLWTAEGCTPLQDINEVLQVINVQNGPTPNIALCGANATTALLALLEAGTITAIKTDSGIDAGNAALASRIDDDRLQYIGTFGAARIPFYAYSGTYIADTTGTRTALIRSDYIEFFNTNNASEQRVMWYGRVPALYLEFENRAVTRQAIDILPPKPERDNYQTIYKTRPLPWLKRPEHYVSLKVAK